MYKIADLKALAGSMRILFVDDEPDIRDKMEELLRKIFDIVVIAADGREALEHYRNNTFEIVMTDISMPHMDGLELVRAIKQEQEMQHVIFVSALSDYHSLSSAITLGADGYLLKPFDYNALIQELCKCARAITLERENRAYKERLEQMVAQKTQTLERLQKARIDDYEQILHSMVELIEDRDTYTAGHSQRVAFYCVQIAKAMGHDDHTCDLIYKAAILHDIGKIATPDSVLLNPGKLSDLEYKLIQEHVTMGYAVLHKIPLFASAAEVMHQHHERYDGSGYPQGLMGEAIHPLSRIMAVADTFDAMTTSRIYKARKEVPQALEELRRLRSVHFDPNVIDAALEVLAAVELDHAVNQLPITPLEQERFAYFYRDNLCGIFNKNYLDVVLSHNSYECQYRYLHLLWLHHFSRLNKSEGWVHGDEVLKLVASILRKKWPRSMIFRIFGDDFVVLCHEPLPMHELDLALDLLHRKSVTFTYETIDLVQHPINSVTQIEGF